MADGPDEDSMGAAIGCMGCLTLISMCMAATALAAYVITRLVGWLGSVFGW